MGEANDNDATTLVVDIGGMHCPNCETLVEQRFAAVPGVRTLNVSAKGVATIVHDGSVALGTLQAAVREDGYTVHPAGEGPAFRIQPKDATEIAAAFAIALGLYLFLTHFDVLPSSIGVSQNTTLGLAFLIGLVASVTTCMAVTGGLLLAAAAKYNEASGIAPGRQRLTPLLYFNAGRLVSYAALGGVVGAVGSALTLSAGANGVITLVASAIMIILGLQMLRLFPSFGWLMPRMSRAFSIKLQSFVQKRAKGGAFVLGAATFFLPCGFTQALQLYVLARGDALTGALTMLAFAVGTLPALLSLSAISSFASGGFQRHFLRFAGAVVVVLGVVTIQSGLTLTSIGGGGARPTSAVVATASDVPATNEGSMQVLSMEVLGFEYHPNRFRVVVGEPVEWRIDGERAAGCGRMLVAPGLGIDAILEEANDTIIRFTPTSPGEYEFNCGMGMMTANSAITVVPQS